MIKVIRSETCGVQLFPTFQGDALQWPNKALTGLFIPSQCCILLLQEDKGMWPLC